MAESDPKELAKEVAKAIVFGVLEVSPRLDTFSTWLMGVSGGFLVLIFTNLERAVNVVKIGPVKFLIAVLGVSTVVGMLQKYLALSIQIRIQTHQAAELKIAEVATAHSGQNVPNPSRYFAEKMDVVHMIVLLISAFPKWMQKRLAKSLLERTADLSDLRKYTSYMIWQAGAVFFQFSCALFTVIIILLSL